MSASTPPEPPEPPSEPRSAATTGGAGGGCLPFLLLFGALWFYTGVWEDALQRMKRMEAAVHTLQQQVDSLRALLPPSPGADSARALGDTVQQVAGRP